MGNELLCTQMCAGCAESIRFFVFLGRGLVPGFVFQVFI